MKQLVIGIPPLFIWPLLHFQIFFLRCVLSANQWQGLWRGWTKCWKPWMWTRLHRCFVELFTLQNKCEFVYTWMKFASWKNIFASLINWHFICNLIYGECCLRSAKSFEDSRAFLLSGQRLVLVGKMWTILRSIFAILVFFRTLNPALQADGQGWCQGGSRLEKEGCWLFWAWRTRVCHRAFFSRTRNIFHCWPNRKQAGKSSAVFLFWLLDDAPFIRLWTHLRSSSRQWISLPSTWKMRLARQLLWLLQTKRWCF